MRRSTRYSSVSAITKTTAPKKVGRVRVSPSYAASLVRGDNEGKGGGSTPTPVVPTGDPLNLNVASDETTVITQEA